MPEILHQDMNVLTDESTVEIERSSPSSSLCAVADWLQSVSKLSKLQGIDLGESLTVAVDIMKTPAIFMEYQNKIE